MRKYFLLIGLLNLGIQGWAQSITHLEQDMYHIAGDHTNGRFTGSSGYLRAANYIAAQLKLCGIKPGWIQGNNHVYLQPVPFSWDNYNGSKLIIKGKIYPHNARNFIVLQRGVVKMGKWIVAASADKVAGNPAGILLLPDPGKDWETAVIRQYRFGYMHYVPDSAGVSHDVPAIMVSPALAKMLKVGDSVEVKISYQSESKTGYNVVGMLEGVAQQLPRNVIIVGAHLDHIGRIGQHIYNGANDDASGCVAALGAARMLAANPGKHTVIFVFFCGEELNLKGSHWFANHLPVPQSTISLMINLEQLGSKHRSFDGVWALGDTLFKQPFYKAGSYFTMQQLQFSPIDSVQDILSNTDTYSFISKRIPSLLLGSGGFEEHHTPMDKINLIDFKHLQKATFLLKTLIAN